MNARTIRKRLMSRPMHRRDVFWGQRAYLTISVPLSMYPEPVPPFEPPGKPDCFAGHWRSPDGGRQWQIGHVSSGRRPEDEADKVELQPCQWGIGWEWWEGRELVMDGNRVAECRPLPEEMIRAYARREQWMKKWVYGYDEQAEGPIGAFLRCGNCAKSTHAQIDGDRVLVRWGVKWFYAGRKLGFCRDLARFLDMAKRAGVDVRVWR